MSFLRVLCVFVVNFLSSMNSPGGHLQGYRGLHQKVTNLNLQLSIADLVFGDLSDFNPPTLAGLFIKIDFLDAFLLDQLEPVGLVQVSDESIDSRLFDCNCLSYY